MQLGKAPWATYKKTRASNTSQICDPIKNNHPLAQQGSQRSHQYDGNIKFDFLGESKVKQSLQGLVQAAQEALKVLGLNVNLGHDGAHSGKGQVQGNVNFAGTRGGRPQGSISTPGAVLGQAAVQESKVVSESKVDLSADGLVPVDEPIVKKIGVTQLGASVDV